MWCLCDYSLCFWFWLSFFCVKKVCIFSVFCFPVCFFVSGFGMSESGGCFCVFCCLLCDDFIGRFGLVVLGWIGIFWGGGVLDWGLWFLLGGCLVGVWGMDCSCVSLYWEGLGVFWTWVCVCFGGLGFGVLGWLFICVLLCGFRWVWVWLVGCWFWGLFGVAF